MTPGQRFKQWLEGIAESWKDQLRGWMLRSIGEGITKFAEDMEPGAIDAYRPYIQSLIDNPHIPQGLKDYYQKALTPGNPFSVGGALITMVLGSLGALLGGSVPIGNFMRYDQERLLHSSRVDPITAINLHRRFKDKYPNVFEDLNDQGWDPSRIAALLDATLFYPAPADLVRWQAREVFEPEMIARYGLDDELGGIEREPFYKAGMTDEQITNFWRAHWEHASWMQIVEMLHRGLLTEEQVYDWFRLVEIPPFWRDLLIKTAYTWPTRVDVRRWWDMRTIDETELRRLYSGMGYRGVNLDNYVLWTKVYTDFPSLMARWTKGWLTEDDVRRELAALGMPAFRIETMIQEKIKPDTAARTTTEKDVTKTDIIKGVKNEVIERWEGIELLIDLGYDEAEAEYVMAINIPQDEVASVVKQRELTKSDIIAGLRNKIISEREALTKLKELRYSAVDSQFLLDIFKATIKPPTEPREREASKADIVKGVKKGLITNEEGYLMLQDIGFTPEASQFILTVHVEESPFSPANYNEFKEITTKWKLATGREVKPMPEELKQAAVELAELTKEVESLNLALKEMLGKIIDEDALAPKPRKKLDDLRAALYRAQAELQRVQTNYNIERAKWRHGG